MTNTRITDPEIMERRYPVVLRQFSIRDGSGGAGKYRGGDGVVRDIEFLPKGIQVSILSERRVFRPYGLEGGEDAQNGRNLWVRRDANGQGKDRTVNLGGKTTVKFNRGDRIVIMTPGGGGWGREEGKAGDGETRQAQGLHADKRSGSLAEREATSLGA